MLAKVWLRVGQTQGLGCRGADCGLAQQDSLPDHPLLPWQGAQLVPSEDRCR